MASPETKIFQVPLEEFTAARNALAQELRKAGRAEEAKHVAGLRKPSQPLWLVNQLARHAPRAIEALLEATSRLRQIQEQGLAGEDLREAMREQREALHELLDAAQAQAKGPLAQAVQRRIQSTLQAAAMSEPSRLREGRLEHELQPSGFEALLAGGAPRPRKTDAAEEKRERATEAARERQLRAAEAEVHELAARAGTLERTAAKADAAAAKAREAARQARAKADEAAARSLEIRRKK